MATEAGNNPTRRDSLQLDSFELGSGALRTLRKRLLLMGSLFILAAVIAVPWDGQLHGLTTEWSVPGDLRKAINLSEVFAHGAGVAAILGSLYLLSPTRRKVLLVAGGITLLAGLTANGLKSCVVRVRPHAQRTIQVAGHGSQADSARHATRLATRAVDPLPREIEVVQASFWDARQRSFPSGHAATAWGLAIGLSLAFPRGWWLFGVFASLACLQRLTSEAHFAGDVLAGAAVACLSATCVLSLAAARPVGGRSLAKSTAPQAAEDG